MNSKAVLFTVLVAGIIIVGTSQTAYGAQLNTIINPNNESSEFQMKYLKTVFIEYEEGGEIAELLRTNNWNIEVTASTPNPDVIALRDAINQKIESDGSSTKISDLTIEYSAVLTGRGINTAIDYKVILKGTIDTPPSAAML